MQYNVFHGFAGEIGYKNAGFTSFKLNKPRKIFQTFVTVMLGFVAKKGLAVDDPVFSYTLKELLPCYVGLLPSSAVYITKKRKKRTQTTRVLKFWSDFKNISVILQTQKLLDAGFNRWKENQKMVLDTKQMNFERQFFGFSCLLESAKNAFIPLQRARTSRYFNPSGHVILVNVLLSRTNW